MFRVFVENVFCQRNLPPHGWKRVPGNRPTPASIRGFGSHIACKLRAGSAAGRHLRQPTLPPRTRTVRTEMPTDRAGPHRGPATG